MTERKPLIVFTPKSLLRHPRARSSVDGLAQGCFEEVLPDPADPDPVKVRRLLLCTGKVAIDLLEHREAQSISDVAIARLEQLYPFPHAALDAQLSLYPDAEVCWVQEEPENMGAWTFVFTHIQQHRREVDLVARPESGSPATGSKTVHDQEQEELLEDALTVTG